MQQHLDGIPASLRSNFYANLGKNFGSRKRSFRNRRSFGRNRRSRSFGRNSRFTKRRRSFGRMVGLPHVMGNYQPGEGMSTFQGYTGMPPNQMHGHLSNVMMADRSNFYANLSKFGSKRKRRRRSNQPKRSSLKKKPKK
jgi:flagellar basal body rod protein FlgC